MKLLQCKIYRVGLGKTLFNTPNTIITSIFTHFLSIVHENIMAHLALPMDSPLCTSNPLSMQIKMVN